MKNVPKTVLNVILVFLFILDIVGVSSLFKYLATQNEPNWTNLVFLIAVSPGILIGWLLYRLNTSPKIKPPID